jgi:hypothetical protein
MTAIASAPPRTTRTPQPRGPVWRGPFPVAMAIWTAMQAEHDAERAGRRFFAVAVRPADTGSRMATGYGRGDAVLRQDRGKACAVTHAVQNK